LRFASLQSEVGAQIAAEHGIDPGVFDTLILVEGGTAYVRSDAALRVARLLRFPWGLAGALLVVPRFVREPLYRLVARYRYRLFGRLDSEWRPASGVEERFL
jgi:predicted DCC family thiol-disulfide oxidoreductase YuxK